MGVVRMLVDILGLRKSIEIPKDTRTWTNLAELGKYTPLQEPAEKTGLRAQIERLKLPITNWK